MSLQNTVSEKSLVIDFHDQIVRGGINGSLSLVKLTAGHAVVNKTASSFIVH